MLLKNSDLTNFRFYLAAAVTFLSVTSGCSDKEPLAAVEGCVYYNDVPLEFGAIMLQPPSGTPSHAKIQPDGRFVLETHGQGEGARIGVNKVRVTCFEAQRPGNSDPNQGEKPLGKSLIPRRYSSYASGLTVEIDPKSNEPLEIRLTDR